MQPRSTRRRQCRRRLAVDLVGAEAEDDVVGLGEQRQLFRKSPTLGTEPDRRQCPLAHDHRVHELDRDVAHVRARRRARADGDQPPAAREALRHPMAAAREPVRLGGEEAPVGVSAGGKQGLDPSL